jgi:hypothetical protein
METTMVKFAEIDRDAFERAIATANERQHREDVLRDGASQIDRMLKDDPWIEVGHFCSYSCQMRSLRLKPWQYPPAWVDLNDHDPEHADGVALLRRLLDAGLSQFEPDPVSALQAIEVPPPAA